MTDVRIAWFSPFPPVRTGIATVSAEVVAALAARGAAIDAYPEGRAHDFPWMHRQRPYDLVVYQFGNSSHHDYAWPYALRYPGLVVLHDTRLHHARAALLLREKRRDDYRRELAWNEPGVNPDVAELAIAGFDSRLYYEWPMVRALVERSRLVAVHGEAARRELVERLSEGRGPRTEDRGPASDLDARIVSIGLGHGQLVSAEREAAARATIRARYGIAPDAVVFGVFGGLTPEKRIPQIVAAFRATLRYAPDARLLLGGAEAAHFPLRDLLADGIVVTGYIEDGELTDHVAAVDVSLNLRWPTARETSGPWLRALAAGKPTVTIDLLQSIDVPSLDPRTWTVRRVEARGSRTPDAVTVAIDIVDEDHSLRLAMRRLAQDPALRTSLGRAARDYWQREHSLEGMTDDYERVMREARKATVDGHEPESGSPHAADTRLRALLAPFGLSSPFDESRDSHL
jgi:glycosyltransferase involved in cell wall biosynthesis